MSTVDAIISYKRTPDEDFYKILNCDEHSSVSTFLFIIVIKKKVYYFIITMR